MSKHPLISVIVPCYKVEQYFDACVESIVSQTYTNLEIILVDDGSPDRIPEMCDRWARKDNRIRVIHKTNGGLSDARNAGIEICTGEFIAFVDGDDYIAPELYERLLLKLVQTNSDITASKIYSLVGSTISEYDSLGNKIKDKESTISGIQYLRYYIGGKIENASWNKLYKRSCFDTIRFRKRRNNEDFLMFYELCQQIKTISFIDYYGYYYRQREGSIVHNEQKFLYFDIMQNIVEIKDDALKNGIDIQEELFKREIQERILFMKNVLKRHKYWQYRKEFYKNYWILCSVPDSFSIQLEANFRRPFRILRIFPFFYSII